MDDITPEQVECAINRLLAMIARDWTVTANTDLGTLELVASRSTAVEIRVGLLEPIPF